MRRTADIMGTAVSLDIPESRDKAVFELVFSRLRQIDERFSTYKPDSEVTLYNQGKLSEKSASVEFKRVAKACRDSEKLTGGYFSAWYGGSYDPSGYVKGWAMAEGAKIIKKHGFKTFALGVGGDILARSDSDKVWNIGIQDPSNPSKILNKLSIRNGAVATSGNYERGAHIINPKTGDKADFWAGFTVIGPDIVQADVLATAGFAAGLKGLPLVKQAGYEALGVMAGRRLYMTDGMARLVAA